MTPELVETILKQTVDSECQQKIDDLYANYSVATITACIANYRARQELARNMKND